MTNNCRNKDIWMCEHFPHSFHLCCKTCTLWKVLPNISDIDVQCLASVGDFHTGCPREQFALFVRIIILCRIGTDNFYYICLKTDVSSFKMSTETLLRSEYNPSYESTTFKTQISKYTEYLLISDKITHEQNLD